MNSDPEYIISDDMRDLICRYMEACNRGDHVAEESILQQIREQGVKDSNEY